MITLNKTEQFLVFCLEIYRQNTNLDGISTFKIFENYAVFDYLIQGFEVLHTQGKQYILADIEDYLANKKH